MTNELTVVVPARNEERNIKKLIERIDDTLTSNRIKYEAIIVDDNSTDNTATEAVRLSSRYPVKLIKKTGKPGKSKALLEGIAKAKTDFICIIDADLQYPPEAIPELLLLAKEKGVGVANRKHPKTSIVRKLMSWTFKNLFGRVLMGLNTDIQSGLKVFRREIIQHVDTRKVTPWTLDLPLLYTAYELGYEIGSLDIDFQERSNGHSKVGKIKTTWEIVYNTLKFRLSENKHYPIESSDKGIIGTGVYHKRQKYITHTKLPHHMSAMKTFTRGQKRLILGILAASIIAFLISPFNFTLLFIGVITFIYFVDVCFSIYVITKSLHFPPEVIINDDLINKLDEKSLPVYTILCPLYKEAQVLPHFVEHMNALNWPKDKLEVMLLLEENDKETIKTAKSLNLDKHFKIEIVPHSLPKTKPKACNYGIAKATGEYVVIYDAEDKPDSLQLKKVHLAFTKLGKKYGCIQCKLNYYNPDQNLLTRLFTAEYSLWFDVILPGIQSIEGIIPLGGTSNHFRREELLSFHAWDPFNVTEDADLGVRLFKAGYKTAIVDSVTLEEANSNVKNWIRQRSRWIKGYFQTYLVHMRKPREFFTNHGIHAVIFQLIVGMRMTFMLINPILWTITLLYFAAYRFVGPTIESLFPPLVFYMAVFALVIGNFMYIYNYMIGCAKRGHWDLVKYVFLIPFYWLLASVASVMAVWQLFFKPHYWEKTLHGLHIGGLPKKKVKEMPTSVKSKYFAKIADSNFASGGILVAAGVIASGANFLYNAYLGRMVNLVEFGTISLIGNIYALTAIVTTSLGGAVAHKTAVLLGKFDKPVANLWKRIRSKTVVASLSAMFVWLISIPVMMRFFNTNDMLPFMLFTPVWFGIIAAVDKGFLNGNLKFISLAVIALAEAGTKLNLAYIFVETGNEPLVYAAIPFSVLVGFGMAWLIAKKTKSILLGANQIKQSAFPIDFFGTSVLTKVSQVAFLSFDIILAKHYLDPVLAGQYALLSLTGKIIFFFGGLFAQFITPLVSKNEGKGKLSEEVFYLLFLITIFASIIGFVVVGLFGDSTVPIIFGEKSRSILPYLPVYGLAIVEFTAASAIINYHQIKKHYSFPIFGFIVALFQVIGIAVFHSGIDDLVQVIFVLTNIQLAVVTLAHFFYPKFKVLYRNILDFLGLFGQVFKNGKYYDPAKLRILVFNWRDTKHKWAGGAELYVQEIAKRWVKEGHGVTLFCGNDNGNPRSEAVDGVQIVRRGGFYTVYLWAFLYYIFKFAGKYDIIVDSENGIPFFTPLYSRAPKVLLIHHVHTEVFRKHLSLPLSLIAQFLEAKVMPLLYRNIPIMTVSDSSKNEIIESGLRTNKSIQLATPGFSKVITKKIDKTKYPSFVYVGRLQHYKNIGVAIRAFALISDKHKDARLNIAGYGESARKLRKLIKELGLQKKVKMLGRINDKSRDRLYARSWAAVQPSEFEGWGITVIEANAHGTPVIASNVNGLRDSVVDGKTGILIPLRNIEAFAGAMEQIIEDSKLRKNMSKSAYVWSKNFTWEKCSSNYIALFEQELNNSNKKLVSSGAYSLIDKQ